MSVKTIKLGADPELFVSRGNGKLFEAFSFLPNQYDAVEMPEGNKVYNDGFQSEFSMPPNTDISKVVTSVGVGLRGILASAKREDSRATLSTKTVVDVSLEALAELPIHLTEFGCMPSFNTYQISGMSMPGNQVPYRFAGGHIHFGIGKQAPEMYSNIVRALDTILGISCVSLFENLDNPVRRRYYGLPGEHRLPPHGLEYRTLSCAWVFHPALAAMILDLARKIVIHTLAGKKDWEADMGEVIETIITCDVEKARTLIRRNESVFEKIGFTPTIDFFKPIEESIPNMDDIAANWNF